ncbi:DUF6265 family protein [Erythrobacter crassostreae]|uniref:DUF1311 domain-containing protein n=1 Tax=Erythrobacter crassostreae TaxID=2828328 RepID=A0A9X1JM81_9SPHN|nr:DUF6265 family protein [Erythrobacter crassostrea]MBV7258488.1 DUF1311 domain-containing protein [Erythrobacter crassostrea]
MRAIVMALTGLALGCAMPVLAQETETETETRIGEDEFESPAATLDQVGWLVGQWAGTGIQGAPAMESWLPESGGTMVGTFVQESSDGSIMFTEHMYLTEEGGSLALKLKHFNADLTGWEEKDGMLTFRLVAIEPCAAYFNALTLRCADPDNPGSGIVAAVRMKSDKPDPQELIFRFDAAASTPISYDCDGTTIAINECLAGIYKRSKSRQRAYVDAALGSSADGNALGKMIRASDAAFDAYRSAECDAVYENWKEGSIRNAMWLRCSIRLTDEHTHTVWQNWLTYQDTSEPILPEPRPSR